MIGLKFLMKFLEKTRSLIKRNQLFSFRPANSSDGGQPGRVIVEVPVGEHVSQAEVREVVLSVKSFQILLLKLFSRLG